MNGSGSASGSVSMQASVNEKEVVINITPSLSGSVQGYEILKNDKTIRICLSKVPTHVY